MPRSKKTNVVSAVVQSLGQQIAQELAAAVTASFNASFNPSHFGVAPLAARRGRPPSIAGKTCRVPRCPRRAAAKGMCQNHYAKARRLKYNVNALTSSQLNHLALDLRSTRHQR